MSNIEQKARELLADAYAQHGFPHMATLARNGELSEMERIAIAATVTALGSAPEGFVVVRVDPTEAMTYAATDELVGGHCQSCSRWNCSSDDARRVWTAMLAARPEVE